LPPAETLDELYLTVLARYPLPAEKEQMLPLLAEAGNQRETCEDIVWVLLNSKEFLYNH
jgi:hypothetical protein